MCVVSALLSVVGPEVMAATAAAVLFRAAGPFAGNMFDKSCSRLPNKAMELQLQNKFVLCCGAEASGALPSASDGAGGL